MSLKKPNASGEVTQALRASLADFIGPNDPAENLQLFDQLAEQGLPVFTLGLLDIAETAEIGNAQLSGWRFLATNSAGTPIAAEVSEVGTQPKMTSLSSDPQLEEVIEAVQEVETLQEVLAQDYELRVLRIPGLLIEAFWLRSRTGTADLVVPYLTVTKELKRGRAYSIEDFLRNVLPLVPKFLEYDDEYEGYKNSRPRST